MLTEEIIKKAKARVDTYTGFVAFEHGNIRFSVMTTKGVREARKLALAGKKVYIHK
jgi:hypothetical protein